MIISFDEDKKLRDAYKKQFKVNANCLNYFCDSNGYKLICIAESELLSEAESCIRIDDINIILPYFYPKLFAYKDGSFISLKEAYNSGVVSRDSIEFIAEFSYDKDCEYIVK